MRFKNLTFQICLYVCLPIALIPEATNKTPKGSWFKSKWPDFYKYMQPQQYFANFFPQYQDQPYQTTQPTKCYPLATVPTLQQNNSSPWTLRNTNLETSGNGGIWDNPELLWKDARINDGTNCGYHVLKNIITVMSAISNLGERFYQDMLNQESIVRQQLLSLDHFLGYFGNWAPIIFQKRKQDILHDLQFKNLVPKEQTIGIPLDKQKLKDIQPTLPKSIRSFINMNEGFIKIEELIGSELELILRANDEFNTIRKNIIIIEYDPELVSIGVDPIGETNQKRIQKFLQSNNDTLGIMWTESGGFNHWIGFVAHKQNGQTMVYYLNSIHHKQPRHAHAVLKLLCPAGFNTSNDIETVRKVVDMIKSIAR
jgi:hypothetical protein